MLGALISAVQKVVNDLRADYTTARAAKLDNLDGAVSGRAPASTALSTSTWTNAKASYLDAPISTALFLKNPRHLPVWIVISNQVQVGSSGAALNTDGFFTNFAGPYGAYASATANDTWFTVCNLTSVSGFFFNAWSPMSNTASDRLSLRITIDGGSALTFSAVRSSIQHRLMLGALFCSSPSVNPAPVDSLPEIGTGMQILLPATGLALGFPGLRFESSLKVEAKVQTRIGTNPEDRAAVTYQLDRLS